MTKLPHAPDLRRYSFGGSHTDLRDITCWKFDALIHRADRTDTQITVYVKCATRGEAFDVFFAKHPGARIFGTGMPLSEPHATAEIDQSFQIGDMLTFDTLG